MERSLDSRKGKRREAIYVLTEIIEENIRKEKRKVFICFADLKSAFDKVNRNVIWKKLREKNVEEKVVKRLEKIYEKTIV